MFASRPEPTPGITVTGATEGDTLLYDGSSFRPATPGGGTGPRTFTSDSFSFSLPSGKTKAAWSFVTTAELDGEVYVQHGYINAWKVGDMTDVDGTLVLIPGTPPEWFVEPEVDGSGPTMTVTLGPSEATWKTTLRLVDAS